MRTVSRLLPLLLVGCADGAKDDTGGGLVVDLTGRWDGTWSVTAASGGCERQAGDQSQAVLTLEHDVGSGAVTISGFEQDSGATGEGDVSAEDAGQALTYTSDALLASAGVRIARDGELLVSASGNTLTGEEAWTWTDTDDDAASCTDGVSTVSLERQL